MFGLYLNTGNVCTPEMPLKKGDECRIKKANDEDRSMMTCSAP